jgi:hypothetical protein
MKRLTSAALPLVAAAVFVLSGSGCTLPRSFTAAPVDDLLDGQEIAVRATGYKPNYTYILWQCEVGRELTEGCGEVVASPTTDSTGSFSLTLFVASSFTDQEGGLVDCVPDVSCTLVMYDQPENTNLVFEHIEFNGYDGLTVTPDRDLTDGQTVSVVGLFVGGGNKVMQCPSGVADYTACDMRTLQYVDSGGSGHFELQMTVFATIQDDQGRTTDCTVPGACMVISDLNHGWSITSPQWHPLEFD